MLCTTKTKLFISILLLLAGCVNNDTTSIFYYSISLEEDGKISAYDQLTKSISGDTVQLDYKSYDSSTHELLGQSREIFRMKNDSIYWILSNSGEYVRKNPLFSSFAEGKCDTAYFEYEKIINCYKGKHNLNIKGKMYNNAHLFYKEKWSIHNDLLMTKIYYDKDLVPILIECIRPKSHFLRIERVDNMPFKPID